MEIDNLNNHDLCLLYGDAKLGLALPIWPSLWIYYVPSKENMSPKEVLAYNREDFLRRFFGVAVSVGFASKIGPIFSFVLDSGIPKEKPLIEAGLLVSAMVVVVGSWQFYFKSIREKPLYYTSRFSIDITIVSFYVLLLLSTNDYVHYTTCLASIMLLYFIWDIARLFEIKHLTGRVRDQYVSEDKFSGPAVTLWWAVTMLFVAVLGNYRQRPDAATTYLMVGIYVLYRIDQSAHLNLAKRILMSAPIFVLSLTFHFNILVLSLIDCNHSTFSIPMKTAPLSAKPPLLSIKSIVPGQTH